MLDTLKNEQVTRFVADVASDLPKYGLDKPQLQPDLQLLRLGEHRGNGRRRTSVRRLCRFGKVEGDEVYARVGEEPFIVAVNSDLLDKIFADPLQWQELAVFNSSPTRFIGFAA